MFHNIDPALASAAIAVIIMLALAAAGDYIAKQLKASFEEDRNDDREGVARAIGMIDTNKH